jgi:hypothetical protein
VIQTSLLAMLVAAWVLFRVATQFAPEMAEGDRLLLALLAYAALAWVVGTPLSVGIAGAFVGAVVEIPVRYGFRRVA